MQEVAIRTMIVEQFDKNGNEIMSENRITPIGTILSKTSFYEFLQFFNMLNSTISVYVPRSCLIIWLKDVLKKRVSVLQ